MIAVVKDELLSIIDAAADICERDRHFFKAEFLRGGVKELVQMAPEREVEPVRHGRWVHYKTEIISDDIMGGEYEFKLFRCSECGYDVGGQNSFHGCPNCRAKMNGGEDGSDKQRGTQEILENKA